MASSSASSTTGDYTQSTQLTQPTLPLTAPSTQQELLRSNRENSRDSDTDLLGLCGVLIGVSSDSPGRNILIGKNESVILNHGDTIRIRPQFGTKAFSPLGLPQFNSEDNGGMGTQLSLFTSEFVFQDLRPEKENHVDPEIELAVKIMDLSKFSKPDDSGGTDFRQEVALLRKLKHANIISIVDMHRTSLYVYMFMQILTEKETKFIGYQILLALEMRSNNVLKTMCGTYAYMAPEVFDVKHANGSGYNTLADCWSLGVSLYVVLSALHPYARNQQKDDEMIMMRRVKARQVHNVQK
ncbi:Checkpoint kinase 2 [Actinomortierella ambigua]|uniref:Checkpoint kinase 2 n=1 Tax=Actinomortierella ambigua TaxID=1343610 RepID=A0A9P6Q1F5_9FUNG|nr:Checkpoint kinase 2 [Actinomortierella ambigua]